MYRNGEPGCQLLVAGWGEPVLGGSTYALLL
jgi:hypothetical protein